MAESDDLTILQFEVWPGVYRVRRHLGCDRVAEEGWAGIQTRQPDAAGTDAEGVGGALGGRFARGANAHSSHETMAR